MNTRKSTRPALPRHACHLLLAPMHGMPAIETTCTAAAMSGIYGLFIPATIFLHARLLDGFLAALHFPGHEFREMAALARRRIPAMT